MKYILALILTTILLPSSYAKVPVVDGLLGELLDKALLISGKSSLPKTQKYKLINDPQGISRVRRIIKEIQSFSGHDFRFKNPTIRIIRGEENSPNAYSLGPAVYITKSTLDILTDRELTAVLAHELAHSEYGHLIMRTVYITGTPFLYLKNLFLSEIFTFNTGRADDYMKRIIKEGHLSLLTEIIEKSSTRQELQADCLAANWLERGRHLGYQTNPLDLNAATNKMMGVNIESIINVTGDDFPPVKRFLAVKSGKHIGTDCRL